MTKEKAEASTLILVDARKLSQGLKTTFKGMAMVFDSIGTDEEITMLSAAGTEEKANTKKQETKTDKKGKITSGNEDNDGSVTKLEHYITSDDVTKIIVQKIKKDRSNNEKIGQILKNFGVAKVSELPASDYEAFLTELSVL